MPDESGAPILMTPNRGYYDRGKLPHRDVKGTHVAVTFRLADSLPGPVLERLRNELAARLDSPDDSIRLQGEAELRKRIAEYEDAGHGACWLKQSALAEVVHERLLASHPGECELHAWCVMPNHVHALLRITELPLGDLLRRWKGATAREINRLLGRSGALWQREYFDRGIRDEEHFRRVRRYIENNPVVAGLCSKPSEWPHSSAELIGGLGSPGSGVLGPKCNAIPGKPGAPIKDARLYGILDLGYVADDGVEIATSELLEGGVDLLQLRAKGLDESTVLKLGERVAPICRAHGVPFIVNDFPELAVALQADGLHVGQDDGSLGRAREVVGEKMIVGRSTHSLEQARAALAEGFDYIGFGPLFPTPTKQGRPGIGLADIKAVEEEVGSQIPVFCIGGIKRTNLTDVVNGGARRVVIVSDLLTASDRVSAVQEVTTMLPRIQPAES